MYIFAYVILRLTTPAHTQYSQTSSSPTSCHSPQADWVDDSLDSPVPHLAFELHRHPALSPFLACVDPDLPFDESHSPTHHYVYRVCRDTRGQESAS